MKLTSSIFLATLFLAAQGPASGSDKVAFLGAQLRDVPPALAAHLDIEGGVVIDGLAEDGPAARAGLTVGDIVTAFDVETVTDTTSVVKAVQARKPGETVALAILRGGEAKTLEVVLGEREKPASEPARSPAFLGVRFGTVPPSVAAHFGLEGGVTVEDVLDDSPAAKAGMKVHDILLSVGDTKLGGPADLPRVVASQQAGDVVEVKWIHRGKEMHGEVTLAARPHGHVPHGGKHFELPGGGGLWFGGPRHSFRGKVFWKDADGKEHTFELPEFGVPDMDLDADEWKSRFNEHFHRHWPKVQGLPEEFHERLERLLKRYHGERFGAPKLPHGDDGTVVEESTNSVSIQRVIRDGYDITIRNENGRRTVDVTKDGKSIAENVPFEDLDKLPKDARERVEELDGGAIVPKPKLDPRPAPRAERVRGI